MPRNNRKPLPYQKGKTYWFFGNNYPAEAILPIQRKIEQTVQKAFDGAGDALDKHMQKMAYDTMVLMVKDTSPSLFVEDGEIGFYLYDETLDYRRDIDFEQMLAEACDPADREFSISVLASLRAAIDRVERKVLP